MTPYQGAGAGQSIEVSKKHGFIRHHLPNFLSFFFPQKGRLHARHSSRPPPHYLGHHPSRTRNLRFHPPTLRHQGCGTLALERPLFLVPWHGLRFLPPVGRSLARQAAVTRGHVHEELGVVLVYFCGWVYEGGYKPLGVFINARVLSRQGKQNIFRQCMYIQTYLPIP